MEILLGFTILAFMGFLIYREKHFSEEKRQLIHALKAKDVQEFVTAEKVAESKPEPELPPEFIQEQDLSDEDFDKHIKGTLGEDLN